MEFIFILAAWELIILGVLGNHSIGMDLKWSRLKHEAIAMEAPASTSFNPTPPPGIRHQQKALEQNIASSAHMIYPWGLQEISVWDFKEG